MTKKEIARLVRAVLPWVENTPTNRARFAASDNPFEQVAALRMTYEAALDELSAALPGRYIAGFGHVGFFGVDTNADFLAAGPAPGASGDFAMYEPDGTPMKDEG